MKEMYSFLDKSNESLTLRPEGTAGIARALITNGLHKTFLKNIFIMDPCLDMRDLRQGRLRQFIK